MTKDLKDKNKLSIIVVGASGDLAKRKIFPAIFSLYIQGLLPDNFEIIGFARTKFNDVDFRNLIVSQLTCRVETGKDCEKHIEGFLPRIRYISGQYNEEEPYIRIDEDIKANNKESVNNRIFYMAIPPSIFVDAAEGIGKKGKSKIGWNRVIIEKPFGRDLKSFADLNEKLSKVISEEETYRIDHYLGKELVQNLLVLRFANLIFEPIWNRSHVSHVQITFREKIGTEGRGGYFDKYESFEM